MVRVVLRWIDSPWAFELSPGLNKLGRNPTNDFRVSDPSVSSFHAELMVEGELKRIYSKYGLWDRFQEQLREYREETFIPVRTQSTWREWRKYLPLLLKGALVTIQLSVLSMFLAVGLGLLLALGRLFGATPLRWLATSYIEVVRGHTAAHPTLSDLLRSAEHRYPVRRLHGRHPRPGAELRRLRS